MAGRTRRSVVGCLAAAGLLPPLITMQPGRSAIAVDNPARPAKIVLLGDSVFDNQSYVGSGPDVVAQLRQRSPAGWDAVLLAVDGSVMAGLPRQIERIPPDATHLVVSIGGNDALGVSSILAASSRSVADTLIRLAEVQDRFRQAYAATADMLATTGLPFALSTIYEPRFTDPIERRVASTALCVLNDVIVREAAVRGAPLLDLRLICADDADFANPIEPSVQGGGKIAGAIRALVSEHDFSRLRTAVFTG